MVFGLFKKKCPVCKMQKKDGGIDTHGQWFCSNNCLSEFEKAMKEAKKSKPSCCGR